MRRSGFQVMTKLIGLVKPLTGYMILAVFMGLVGHLCAAFITVFGGFAVLEVLMPGNRLPLNMIFISVIIFAGLRGILRYAEQACNHYIAFKLLALIRDRVFYALRRLTPAKLEGKEKGNLISIITSDIELLEVFYAHTISPICIAGLFSFFMILLIGSYDKACGLLAFVAYITVGMLIPVITSKCSGKDGMEFREKSGKLSGFMLDSLRGLSETLQYGQGAERMREIQEQTEALSEEEKRLKKTAGRNTAMTNLLLLFFDLAMLVLSARTGSFEHAVICTLAMMSSFGPVVALAALGATLQNTFAAGNRVLDLLEEEPVTEEIVGKEQVMFAGAGAEHIAFSYGAEKILDDFSVEIPENKIIGIVGRSGSGKSTLLKLFMRFWKVQKGCVQISHRNLEEINTADLRNMESFVTQETYLFHDSIRNNLKIAKSDATEEELISACKKASIHEFIVNLKDGYDTQVGELGETLSGGERQRLGLARAFLHDAPFMLLDEPTSNLDSLNEAVILKSLYEEREGKTILLVSHRRSTMGIVDQEYSVEYGRMS